MLSRAPRGPLCALALLVSAVGTGCSTDEDNPGTGGSGGSGGIPNQTVDAGPAAPVDWTMLGYDNKSTYWNRGETKISKDTVGSLELAWEYDTVLDSPNSSGVTGAPAIVGDVVYFNGYLVGVYAVSATTGDRIWLNPDISGSSSIAYEDGALYVAGNGDVLFKLDPSTGTKVWERDCDDHGTSISYSSPVIAGDYILMGGSSAEELTTPPDGVWKFRGFVIAINKNDGTVAWKKYTVDAPANGASLWSTVSVDEELGLVIGSTGNNYTDVSDTSDAFIALDLSAGDGPFEWTTQLLANDTFVSGSGGKDYDFGANPILFEVGDQKLAAGGTKGGDFWVLDRTTGTEITRRNLDAPDPGAAFKGGVFVNGAWDGSSLLVAVNDANSDAAGAQAAETGGNGTSVLFALDPLTLDVKWERQLGSAVFSPITVANGVGFVGRGVTLEAFDTATGAKLFEYATTATIASAPVVSNGRVVFGSGMPWIGTVRGTKLIALELP